MEIENQFTIPEAPDDVFDLLLDVERVAPCLPGAQLTGRDGDRFSGTMRVKVGPMTVAYEGTAEIKEVDAERRQAVLVARGSEIGGQGGANARVQLEVREQGEASSVRVHTDLDITGRAAQFGRGVMSDVAGRIVQQFADNLEATLTRAGPPDEAAEARVGMPPEEAKEARHAGVGSEPAAEPLDLLAASWEPVVRRSAPYLVAVLIGILLGRLFFRGGSREPRGVYVLPQPWDPSRSPAGDR